MNIFLKTLYSKNDYVFLLKIDLANNTTLCIFSVYCKCRSSCDFSLIYENKRQNYYF